MTATPGATEAGGTDLTSLLRGLSPRRNPGRYVFAMVPDAIPPGADPVVSVREQEGLTLVLSQEQADQLGLAYRFVAAWITLDVHSALEAVGLIAAVSVALAEAGISANVVAGSVHDHLFVPHSRAGEVIRILHHLAATN